MAGRSREGGHYEAGWRDAREQMGTATIALGAEALEAESVIAVGLDDTAVAEQGETSATTLATPLGLL